MLGQKCGRDRKRKLATGLMETPQPPPEEPKKEVVPDAKTYAERRARLKG